MPTSVPARTDAEGYHTSPLNLGSVASIAASVILCAYLGMVSDLAWLLMCAGALAVLLLPWARSISLIFFALLSGLCGILDYYPISLGQFNAYASDFVIVILGWAMIHFWYAKMNGQSPAQGKSEITLGRIWIVWTLLGLLFVVYGYSIVGSRFDRVFGDFRRATVYSAAFFIPLLFPYSKQHDKGILWATVAGGMIIVLIGYFRLANGIAARIDENFETGHFALRLMNMAETMGLVSLIAFLTIKFRDSSGIFRRTVAAIGIIITSVLLVLSGFRLAMGFVVLVPLLTLAFQSWAQRQKVLRFALVLMLIGAALLPFALVMPTLMPDQFEKVALDLRLRLVNENIQGGFRWWTYERAIKSFAESPIIGHGYGYYLVVAMRNQIGLFDFVEMNNPHNMFLWVLYQTGIVGFIPFTAFHLLFGWHAMRALRTLDPKYVSLYVVFLVTYACYMAYMCFQPFVASQYILMYFIMGLLLRLARPAPDNANSTSEL
ncbi:MAG: O-antigen ligase family protein [Candidatus Hydrogenedentes bacterium]|nr:O-antigen ligase family protein [Candidatus Hydrogenedentota bacterium]